MEPIVLRVTKLAGRGTQRGQREITGRIASGRKLYVDESGAETLIVSVDQETIMASGRDLHEAAAELADIHGRPVRMLAHDGREIFTVSGTSVLSA